MALKWATKEGLLSKSLIYYILLLSHSGVYLSIFTSLLSPRLTPPLLCPYLSSLHCQSPPSDGVILLLSALRVCPHLGGQEVARLTVMNKLRPHRESLSLLSPTASLLACKSSWYLGWTLLASCLITHYKARPLLIYVRKSDLNKGHQQLFQPLLLSYSQNGDLGLRCCLPAASPSTFPLTPSSCILCLV